MKRGVRAAFQGELGAFSQVAARQLLGETVKVVPCTRFDLVFEQLASGKVDAAVVPIENTLHGSIHENYDHLLKYGLEIVAETQVRIVHNLIVVPGVKFSAVRKVYSHPVALNQCLKFFADNQQLERVPFYDTAGSVKMILEQEIKDSAAIASSIAAEQYDGQILRKSIEDDVQNFTRFFLLRRPGSKPEIAGKAGWKTSLVFTTPNKSGSLFRALSAFALRDLSLSKIESRPLPGKPYEYLYYLDFLGKASDPVPQKALAHLEELADMLKILGSYPRSV